jgi:phosphoglycerate dehydrogenase-like enzyme
MHIVAPQPDRTVVSRAPCPGQQEERTMTYKLTRFYAERHPLELRELVVSSIPDDFELRSVSYSDAPDVQADALAWCDVALFAPGRHLPDEVIGAAERCRLFQIWSSGYDKFNILAATAGGIPVANNGGANAATVAEHTFMLMLAASRRLPEQHERARTGRWEGNAHGMDAHMLLGKTLGIVGLGSIGSELAQRATGFGMQVVYSDPRRRPDLEDRHGYVPLPMDELLAIADVVSLHVHNTPETENLIDAGALARMKPGVILINTSRGELIDESALLDAVRSGHVRGVGLDAFRVEPTPPDDPLLTHPSVIATPHYSSTVEGYAAMLSACVANLRRACAGEPPRWVVNDIPVRTLPEET